MESMDGTARTRGGSRARCSLPGYLVLGCLLGLSAPALGQPDSMPTSQREATPAGGFAHLHLEGPFLMADVEVVEMPAPPEFAAPLPTDLSAFSGDWSGYPPRSHVLDALCDGDADMWDRLLTALRGCARGGATLEEVRATYGQLLAYHCGSEAFCARAIETATDPTEPPSVRYGLLDALARCGLPAEAAITAGDVPPELVLRWAELTSWTVHIELSDAIVASIRDAVAAGAGDLMRASRVLAELPEDRATELLLELYDAAQDDGTRYQVAMSLAGRDDPRAREIFQAACRTRRAALDGRCQDPDGAGPVGWSTDPRDLDVGLDATPEEAVRANYSAFLDYLEAHPERRAELVEAAARCVESPPGPGTVDPLEIFSIYPNCLDSLVTLDRRRAAAIAGRLPLARLDFHIQYALRYLLRFPDGDALRQRLRSLGLIGEVDPAHPPVAALVDAAGVMQWHGRVHGFDTETGGIPVGHDSLLRRLAPLADSELEGALFAEAYIPAAAGAGAGAGRYRLLAYLDGRRYTAPAVDRGDWYDVDSVLGLLNFILASRGSDTRFLALSSFSQVAWVGAGPREGLESAIEEGLLTPGPTVLSRGEDPLLRMLRDE